MTEMRLRLYAVADIHGLASRMAAIRKNLQLFIPGVPVLAGDVPIAHFPVTLCPYPYASNCLIDYLWN
jgi:hypothetical protein